MTLNENTPPFFINSQVENDQQFSQIENFLRTNPSYMPKLRGVNQPTVGSNEYFITLKTKFVNARRPKAPTPPITIPDELVSFILEHYFKVNNKHLEYIQQVHQLSMGAENIVGDLLERYINSVLKHFGWIWCSGSTVASVDFIKLENSSWKLLQVKNRDNSENSSSSKVRDGTDILKWHRTFSKRKGDNWLNFPDVNARPYLNEADFKAFVYEYLIDLNNIKNSFLI